MIPVVLGATFLIYALVFALPGDPTSGKCGDKPCPATVVAELREKYNLDDPLPVAYAKYMGNVVTGDLGYSYYFNLPVSSLIVERLAEYQKVFDEH